MGRISLHSHVGTSQGRVEKEAASSSKQQNGNKNRTTSEDWQQGGCVRRRWTGYEGVSQRHDAALWARAGIRSSESARGQDCEWFSLGP
jgi:hypothetical protein